MGYITNPSRLFAEAEVSYCKNAELTIHAPLEDNALHLGNFGVPLPEGEPTKTILSWDGTILEATFTLPRIVHDIILPSRIQHQARHTVGPFNTLDLSYSFSRQFVGLRRVEGEQSVSISTHLLGEDGQYTYVAFDGLCRALAKKVIARRKTDSLA